MNLKGFALGACILGLAVFGAMSMTPATASAANVITVPDIAPLPPAPHVDARKSRIGRQMYFDKLLAADGQQGCKLCHDPKMGWAQKRQISNGYPATEHFRNAQSTVNSVYPKEMGHVGAYGGLNATIQYHWSSPYILARDGRLVIQVWRQFPWYMQQWKEVYGHMPSYGTMKNALEHYVRTLTSRNVPLDSYIRGNDEALSQMAQNGLALFKGKARCIVCHNGPLLSDEKYHNLMVPENPIIDIDPLMQVTRRFEYRNFGVPGASVWCRGSVPDLPDYQPQPCTQGREPMFDMGRFTVTKEWKDLGKFKTAMLRDVSRTSPYMHNGMVKQLEDVIDFYNEGGGPMWQPTNVHFAEMVKSPLIKRLGLSKGEKADLLALLDEGLTGTEIAVEIPKALPPPPARPVQLMRMLETNWVYKHGTPRFDLPADHDNLGFPKAKYYGEGESKDQLHGHN